MGATSKKKVKRRLKKSARRTIAALLLVTAIIVAAIPVQDVSAVDPVGITLPVSVDKLTPISGLNVVKGTGLVGYYVSDSAGTCNLDNTYFQPLPLYNVSHNGSASAAATLNSYNEDFKGYPLSGECPINEYVGIGTPTKQEEYVVYDDPDNPDDTKTHKVIVDYTCEYDLGQESLTIKSTILPSTEPGIPAKFISKSVTQEWKCLSGTAQMVYIADGAFQNKSNFNSFKLPKTIVKIGNEAFRGCASITSIEFGTGITSIGNLAFEGCGNLQSATFSVPNACSCTTFGAGAFANCTNGSFNTFTFPVATAETGEGIFFGDYNLTTVNMNNANGAEVPNFNKLGSYAFMGCTSLTDIILTPKLSTGVGEALFANCINLQNVEMTNTNGGVTYPTGTFTGCGALKRVKIMSSNTTFESKDEFNDQLADFAIYGDMPSANQTIYTTYLNSTPYPGKDQSGLTYYYKDSNGLGHYERTVNGYKFTVDESSDTNVTLSSFGKANDAGDTLTIPSKIGDFNIVKIGDNFATGSDSSLIKTVKIPTSITKIGNNAFSGMSLLENVDINTIGVEIMDEAFANNSHLKDVKFTQDSSSGETRIGKKCFYNCNQLETVSFRNDDYNLGSIYDVNVTSIDDEAFRTMGGKLTIKGKMVEGYAPFDHAVHKDNTVSDNLNNQYIFYRTGNPYNLEAQYNPDPDNDATTKDGIVSLLKYPEMETIVDTVSGNTVKDILEGTPTTQVQKDIQTYSRNIGIPAGVKSIIDVTDTTTKNTYFRDLTNTETPVSTLILDGVTKLPTVSSSGAGTFNTGAFANNLEATSPLKNVIFNADMTDIGTLPFYDSTSINSVIFNGETNPGTVDNPFYWCEKGIIFSSYIGADGKEIVTLEEVLPSRGSASIEDQYLTSDETAAIDQINPRAFQNCDYIKSVDFSSSSKLTSIPDNCFLECDNLRTVYLPETVTDIGEYAFSKCFDGIEVTIPGKEVDIDDTAFSGTGSATLKSYKNSAVERYAKRFANIRFHEPPLDDTFTVIFADYNGDVLDVQSVASGKDATPPASPTRTGYTFTGWRPNYTGIKANVTCIAQYTANSTTSTTSSTSKPSTTSTTSSPSTTSTTSSPSTTSTTKSSSSASSSSSSSSSTSNSSSSSSSSTSSSSTSTIASTVKSGTGTGTGTGSTGGKTSTGSTSKPVGNTRVVANTAGITDIGKMSATVNGSTDSYVIKITDTPEADAAAQQALLAKFGSLDAVRYLPMDISLYDSTGTTKISPIPEGVTVSITMPIPDDLAIYGGNAKPALTEDGKLRVLNPRFTVINGIPCMNFTIDHLSPYVVYVDTSNLAASGSQDATPVTGDPIHPKWFLVIGLSAFAVVLFLKRDPEEKVRTA